MAVQEGYLIIAYTEEYALCKVNTPHSNYYGEYVIMKCTIKRANYWKPITKHYANRYVAEGIYRRLIDGSKNL